MQKGDTTERTTTVKWSGHSYCVDESDIQVLVELLEEKDYSQDELAGTMSEDCIDEELEELLGGKYGARATVALIQEARFRAFTIKRLSDNCRR